METHNQSDFSSSQNVESHLLVFFGVIMAILTTTTVLANGTILLAMIKAFVEKSRGGREHTTQCTNDASIVRMLAMSISLCGLAVGVFIMPLSLVDFVVDGRWRFGSQLCSAYYSVNMHLSSVLHVHSLLMAYNTFFLVMKPLKYRQLTIRDAAIVIAVNWIVPTLVVIVKNFLNYSQSFGCAISNLDHYMYHEQFDIFAIIYGSLFLIMYLVSWTLYVFILREIRAFQNGRVCKYAHNEERRSFLNGAMTKTTYLISIFAISSSQMDCFGLMVTLFNNDTNSTGGKHVTVYTKLRSRVKSFAYVGMVLTCFTVCWFPIWTMLLMCISSVVCLPKWAYLLAKCLCVGFEGWGSILWK
ncbi:hypothetical protein Btru_056800 [Bulinus truncatus]|nr:hypothetical protein Btru_056800 [Bulinus truncatus]